MFNVSAFFHVTALLQEVIALFFRLKELREKKHMSQTRLAIELNMNQNTLSRYENRQREADYETLIRIADFFDVSLDYLLGRSNESK